MTAEHILHDDPRLDRALDELRDMIRRHFPDATFWVEPSVDDPTIVHLVAEADVEDTEEVLNVVLDRMIEMQAEEGLPLFVLPRRTPARIAARWADRAVREGLMTP